MEIGDILIEWSYSGFSGRDKHFVKHVVKRITPTGRIKTDKGLELNPDLSIRGASGYNRSYISLFTDEIKEEIAKQRQKDKLRSRLRNLDINQLNPKEIISLNNILDQIPERI